MVKIKKCLNCSKEFEYTHENSKFCTINCKKKYSKKRESETLQGIEGEDYIICELCGNRVKRIYGKHLKIYHKGVTSNDYKKMFPGKALSSNKDKHNISVNSGKYMKDDKWRKWASDKMKGEKNINHSSKTTEQRRKETSPFSKEFYKKEIY
jgi:DNA-directed RNA polymerase subunit RPC12/RpoP